VLLESITKPIIFRALKELGYVQGIPLLVNYKLGRDLDKVFSKIKNIANEEAVNAPFLSGAEEVLNYFSSAEHYELDVCSNSAVAGNSALLESEYRKKSPTMNNVKHYELLPPDSSKESFYIQASYGFDTVYVLDDMVKNVYDAYKNGCIGVLISNNKSDLKKAKNLCTDKSRFLHFGKTLDFAEYMKGKLKSGKV
jgi:hypothetical protein